MEIIFFVVGGILYSLGWKLFCDLESFFFFYFCFSFWIVCRGVCVLSDMATVNESYDGDQIPDDVMKEIVLSVERELCEQMERSMVDLLREIELDEQEEIEEGRRRENRVGDPLGIYTEVLVPVRERLRFAKVCGS